MVEDPFGHDRVVETAIHARRQLREAAEHDGGLVSDRVAEALFVGREELLGDLVGAVRAGRNMIRAVMGGRGMGKSSLARQLAK
ncbi:MAG TPA: hypothetical protein PKL63_00435, partial [Dermatophilaceae bacterium]|nr:hypothetical protein [Dermatophilaceae bacterium]